MKRIYFCILIIALLTSGCRFQGKILTLKGDIENNIISANSTVAGKIMKMNVQQGSHVKKGDIIAVIDNVNQKYAVDQVQATVNMKKAHLDELKAGARPQEIAQAEAQVQASKAQVRASESQVDLLVGGNRPEQIEQAKNAVSIAQEALNSAKTTYNQVESDYNKALSLYQSGAISQNDLDKAKALLDLNTNQVNAAQKQLETSQQQYQLMQNGATSQSIDAARANYDAAKSYYDAAVSQVDLLKSGSTIQSITFAQADLDQSTALLNQAQNTLNDYNIVALADGIIISKNVELGDIVTASSNIADIAIDNDIYLLCYIPDQYLDKVYYDQQLTVKTSLGEQTGKVNYIALTHEYTPKDKQSTTDDKHIATKIKIKISDDSNRLKSGMKATVQVPLE